MLDLGDFVGFGWFSWVWLVGFLLAFGFGLVPALFGSLLGVCDSMS